MRRKFEHFLGDPSDGMRSALSSWRKVAKQNGVGTEVAVVTGRERRGGVH